MKIREELSSKLGVMIAPNGWESTFDSLDRMGRFTPRVVKDLLIVLCKKLEELESDGQSTNPTQPDTKEPI